MLRWKQLEIWLNSNPFRVSSQRKKKWLQLMIIQWNAAPTQNFRNSSFSLAWAQFERVQHTFRWTAPSNLTIALQGSFKTNKSLAQTMNIIKCNVSLTRWADAIGWWCWFCFVFLVQEWSFWVGCGWIHPTPCITIRPERIICWFAPLTRTCRTWWPSPIQSSWSWCAPCTPSSRGTFRPPSTSQSTSDSPCTPPASSGWPSSPSSSGNSTWAPQPPSGFIHIGLSDYRIIGCRPAIIHPFRLEYGREMVQLLHSGRYRRVDRGAISKCGREVAVLLHRGRYRRVDGGAISIWFNEPQIWLCFLQWERIGQVGARLSFLLVTVANSWNQPCKFSWVRVRNDKVAPGRNRRVNRSESEGTCNRVDKTEAIAIDFLIDDEQVEASTSTMSSNCFNLPELPELSELPELQHCQPLAVADNQHECNNQPQRHGNAGVSLHSQAVHHSLPSGAKRQTGNCFHPELF